MGCRNPCVQGLASTVTRVSRRTTDEVAKGLAQGREEREQQGRREQKRGPLDVARHVAEEAEWCLEGWANSTQRQKKKSGVRDELSFDADLNEVCQAEHMHANSSAMQLNAAKHTLAKRKRHWRRHHRGLKHFSRNTQAPA